MPIDYAILLKRGCNAAMIDQKYFRMWSLREISLRKCFECFSKNNIGKVIEDYWDPDEFRKWLNSLGYSSQNN